MRNLGRGPAMRTIRGNLASEKLPGGSLIAAVLDRRLMTWSDRGGASRHLGERWSEQCALALDAWRGTQRPVPGDQSFRLDAVVRLDENPQIAIQAGRYKLVNPDFVLYGARAEQHVLQAADAKFAVDTIRSAQVSADALRALLAVEGGLVGSEIARKLNGQPAEAPTVVRGVFLSPMGPLTDFFLPRVTSGPHATVDPREVVLLPVDPVAMFAGLPATRLVGTLARVDQLPVSPRLDILPAIYYFRVASACLWMWVEQHTPLLSLEPPKEPDPDVLLAAVRERAERKSTAFGIVLTWSDDIEELERSRRAFNEVSAMPVRMRELRALLEAAGRTDERGLLRRVRGALERRYRRRLVEEVGAIPSHPDRPLPEILQSVAAASRGLRPELLSLAEELVEESPVMLDAAGGDSA